MTFASGAFADHTRLIKPQPKRLQLIESSGEAARIIDRKNTQILTVDLERYQGHADRLRTAIMGAISGRTDYIMAVISFQNSDSVVPSIWGKACDIDEEFVFDKLMEHNIVASPTASTPRHIC